MKTSSKTRRVWTEELIELSIRKLMEESGIDHFPSHKLIRQKDCGLDCAITRNGGYIFWKKKLGLLDPKEIQSLTGWYGESLLEARLLKENFVVEKEPVTCIYDYTINHCVKIDCKFSHIYHGINGDFFSFNLGSSYHDCDIFICICEFSKSKCKYYVIPSIMLNGQKQISMGIESTKWFVYENRFDLIKQYEDFYSQIKKEFSNGKD